ncbi:MAG: hypothetical protein LBP21_07245 [Synergistaceae bacterium]|nr:hypothetical protein [Synergistaceae bacterium]
MKPHSEDLVPDFMQEAMDLFRALFVYFGLPGLTACLLLRYQQRSWTLLPTYYFYVLATIFTRQSLFYLLHLGPALVLRYLVYGARFGVKGSLFIAVSLDFLSLLIVYPVHSLLNFEVLKNIYTYAALCPLSMTFFTLRIPRLRFLGGVVLALFIGLLCWNFFGNFFGILGN